jgi:hypothetical protein
MKCGKCRLKDKGERKKVQEDMDHRRFSNRSNNTNSYENAHSGPSAGGIEKGPVYGSRAMLKGV